jgi:hypothetical protein
VAGLRHLRDRAPVSPAGVLRAAGTVSGRPDSSPLLVERVHTLLCG